MDCKYANYLMMKYMDQILSENEAISLNSHVSCCTECKEDFMLYDFLIVEFEKESACLFEPPDGFEACVMEKIACIEPDYCGAYLHDMAIGFAVIMFSLLSGIGVVASMYWTEITTLAAGYPYAEAFMSAAGEAALAVSGFVYSFSQKAFYYTGEIFNVLDAAKYGILTIVTGLVAAQCLIYSGKKVEV